MSHSATMFSLFTLPMVNRAWFAVPIMPIFSFSLGDLLSARARLLKNPAPTKADPARTLCLRNSRRLWRDDMECSPVGGRDNAYAVSDHYRSTPRHMSEGGRPTHAINIQVGQGTGEDPSLVVEHQQAVAGQLIVDAPGGPPDVKS